MSIQDAAAAAVKYFDSRVIVQTPGGPYPLPVVMVAIAGQESGWRNDARGDYGLYDRPRCNGYTSFGLWQYNTIHGAWLRNVTGSADPCAWAQWLFIPDNNARAAKSLYTGPESLARHWKTTWDNGYYLKYLGQAQAAVAAVKPPPVPNGDGKPPSPWLLWALTAGGIMLLGVTTVPILRRKVEGKWKRSA